MKRPTMLGVGLAVTPGSLPTGGALRSGETCRHCAVPACGSAVGRWCSPYPRGVVRAGLCGAGGRVSLTPVL